MAKILEGKTLNLKILETLKRELLSLSKKPILAIVQVGERVESGLYIKKKKEFGEKSGFEVKHVKISDSLEQQYVIGEIIKLNKDNKINGIIVQLPLPPHLSFFDIIESIDPDKDVDGLHSRNLKRLMTGDEKGLLPATAKAILTILDFYQIQLSGKRAAVIGRSILVGKPTALLLLNRDTTVTICHRGTKNLEEICKTADILVSAIGVPQKINKNFVSSGQVVIDVGINAVSREKMQEEVGKRKIVGDVNFEEVEDIVSAITPVPGGVGPMTVACLFGNVLKAYKLQQNK